MATSTLRISPVSPTIGAEVEGLDLSEHDMAAYPDFQQTYIKSFHVREI